MSDLQFSGRIFSAPNNSPPPPPLSIQLNMCACAVWLAGAGLLVQYVAPCERGHAFLAAPVTGADTAARAKSARLCGTQPIYGRCSTRVPGHTDLYVSGVVVRPMLVRVPPAFPRVLLHCASPYMHVLQHTTVLTLWCGHFTYSARPLHVLHRHTRVPVSA